MGAYEDTSWAELRALTRLRRQQTRDGKLPSWAYVEAEDRTRYYRVGHDGVVPARDRGHNQDRHLRWRKRQWRNGVRTCFWCHEPMSTVIGHPSKVTLDHYVPRSRGGRDSPTNWVLACARCNAEKGDLMPNEYARILASRMALAAE